MTSFVLLALLAAAFCASLDLDPADDLNEEEFSEYFHHSDSELSDGEKLEREEALVENEKIIKETNSEFLAGKIHWWDRVNEDSDLPSDEFQSEKTGARVPSLGRGLLEPLEEQRVDAKSEKYFSKLRQDRADIPESYSSVDLGIVSPVKNQKQCGSCVAFSNMALVETCFSRLTGQFGDYSEQQLIDCGYGQNGGAGCDGAPPHAYVKWAAENAELGLLHESDYPYSNTQPTYTCPADLAPYNQGAEVTDYYYTYSGDEETLAKLVFQHGAAVTSVKADGPFQDYGGGIFGGCTDNSTNHAVTVVGYGVEDGEQFWLIKNSWGPGWGEDGFIRLRRGVGMCGVGRTMVTLSCSPVPGPTDRPLTTEAPCEDKWSNCPSLAASSCYKESIARDCRKSCGLCPGLTPAASNTCYDTFGNCPELAETNCHRWGPDCLKSCGLCDGLTPHPSNTCYDTYSNCADICHWYSGDQCNLGCGRC